MQRCKNHSADNHIGSSNINTNYEGLFMDSDIEVAKYIMSSAGTKFNLPAEPFDKYHKNQCSSLRF